MNIIMLCGTVVAIAGVILHMYVKYNPAYFFATPWVLPFSLVLAITGFVVYFVGRIMLARQRSRARRNVNSEIEE